MIPYLRWPAPSYTPIGAILAQTPPEPSAPHERNRARAAARRARQLWPGPVGELVEREIEAWTEFGWRTEHTGLIPRLVDQVMKAPSP
jgi:hypothetical protein